MSIENAPKSETNVSFSFRYAAEMARETMTSASSMIVELTAEMCFRPSDHR